MIRTKTWTTVTGKRRRIRLFEAWLNMNGRVNGGKSKDPGRYWNTSVEFDNWEHFREWAVRAGYRKGVELDRRNSAKSYGPSNCQWIEKRAHSRKSRAAHRAGCMCPSCAPRVVRPPAVPAVDLDCVPF